MSKENLSQVDAAWLHMEDPTNLMMINGFFQFDGVLDYERVKETLEQRLLRFTRFKQRVVDSDRPFRSPYWETDPHFDLDAHLHRIALPSPGDDVSLRELVSDLASTPLDFSKPLWQFHIIEGYGSATLLYARLHHSIADGIALMHVMLSMCDEEPDAPWSPPEDQGRRSRGPLGRLLSPARNAYRTTRKLSGEGLDMLRHPLDTANDASGFAKGLSRLTFLPPDPKTIFKGKLGVSKRAAWSEPLPLQAVKEVGQVMGGTINDVLLTTVTGALRRYLIARDQPVAGIEIRAMVPVNLRPPEQAFKLGNYFGLVVLALPIGLEDPLQRLLVLKRRMDNLKQSAEPVVGLTILQAMGLAPGKIERLGVEFFANKTTAVMTNVPGPRKKLYFAGRGIDKVMFWVPQSGRMGMGVSILSYAGEVVLGVITDAGLVPDPEAIITEFHNEFVEMQERVAEIEASAYRGEIPVVDEQARGRCRAKTQSGAQCKNRTMAGSAYCHIHAKIVGDSEDLSQ